MRSHTAFATAIGVGTGILFVTLLMLGASQTALALLAPFAFFLPMIPLFGIGLLHGVGAIITACLGAWIVAILTMGGDVLTLFTCATIAPVLLAYVLLTTAPQPRMVSVVEGLTWLAVGFTLLTALMLWPQEYDGIRGMEGLLRSQFTADIAQLSQDQPLAPDTLNRLTQLTNLTFIFPAMAGWGWVLLTLGQMALAHKAASRFGAVTPAALTAGTQDITPSFLGWLAIAGLGSLIGSPALAFLCKALFIILLLPYFIVAMFRAHQKARIWPNGGFALACLYGVLVFLIWPALVMAVVAAVRHGIRIASPATKNE